MSVSLDVGAGLLAAFVIASSGCRPSSKPREATVQVDTPRVPFVAARAEHPTVLTSRAPSPERLGEPPAPAGARAVRYRSEAGELLAWLATPSGPGPHPVLVYFHGGFALAPSDFAKVLPVLAAGFAVMTPSWRGENGNPGSLELLFGELDDAVAAIEWVAAQPEIDPARIHVLGHSVGGGLAALVSLRSDAKVASTASVGGLYVPETFVRWAASDGNAKLIRFDTSLAHECELRVLGPHVADMVHPHTAYIGREDEPFLDNAKRIAAAAERVSAPLNIEYVDGDHEGSIGPAVAAWIATHGDAR